MVHSNPILATGVCPASRVMGTTLPCGVFHREKGGDGWVKDTDNWTPCVPVLLLRGQGLTLDPQIECHNKIADFTKMVFNGLVFYLLLT